ncbi:VOC family protein [Streptomyces sp. NPDC059063]|uniref:VOC family protein n=1 Tax=unclassified Streptomyces TaxID=2593676 RepID=UPI0036B11320
MTDQVEHAEGEPCWADVMFPDVGAAKDFYGELFGWTFVEGAPEFGGYTQAYVGGADGAAVAAVSPQMPDMAGQPPAWNLYFTAPDIEATAARIRTGGGTLLMEPMQVADFGTMVTAQDPSGVYFSAWQAGSHRGFEKRNAPGAFCWAEVNTRDVAKADAFFTSVFPFEAKRMVDEHIDYQVWQVGGAPALGRMKMGPEVPAEVPPHISVYFGVDDCDAAVATVQRLGGRLNFGPMSSPFGRFAAVSDQQGAAFAVIDLSTTEGEMPELV